MCAFMEPIARLSYQLGRERGLAGDNTAELITGQSAGLFLVVFVAVA